MHNFFQFTFDTEKLKKNLRDPWLTLYDPDFVDQKVIGGIEKHLPAVAEVMRYVEKKATGKVMSKLSQSGLNLMNKEKDKGSDQEG